MPLLRTLLRGLALAHRPTVNARQRLGGHGVELLPSDVLRGRDLRTQRALARSRWLLRDAASGKYLAVLDKAGRICPLARLQANHPLLQRPQLGRERRELRALGIGPSLATRGGQRPCSEPAFLQWAGRDRYDRPLWLTPAAGRAWSAMQVSAQRDGIQLQAISGFRSFDYQAAILRRKLDRGLTLDAILTVNAAPGYSEHHSGCALDIGCPGEPPAEESFELTAAFRWLRDNAIRFGFHLSYPRGNRFGIVYEPWHWCWHPPAAGSLALPRAD